MSNYENQIRENWENLNLQIESLCDSLNRPYPLVIAVSKTRSIDEILAAYDVGIRHFGENYAQELENKAKSISKVKWHFIGHLQRSNVKRVMLHASYFHTLDSERLTDKIANFGFEGDCLIQVKISDELSKHGIENDREKIRKLLIYSSERGIKIKGLMSIGGLSWGLEKLKQEFTALNQLNNSLELYELSLGMSNDYQVAIECGSTMVRIGTTIFGDRQ